MVACESVYMYILVDWEAKRLSVVAYRRWSLTKSGRYKGVFGIKINHTCDMRMKLHGVVVSSFNLFSGFFLQLAYIPCFLIWRSKANYNDLFDYIMVISFRCCINISKLNILLWAAVLWLSCCDCCVNRLFLSWLSPLKKSGAFAKSLYSRQSTTCFCAYYVFSSQNCFYDFCSRAIKNSGSLLRLRPI